MTSNQTKPALRTEPAALTMLRKLAVVESGRIMGPVRIQRIDQDVYVVFGQNQIEKLTSIALLITMTREEMLALLQAGMRPAPKPEG